jgi:hypothetical protein
MITIHISRRVIVILAALGAIFALGAASCDSSQQQAQRDENGQQAAVSGQLLKNQPIPNIPYSQVRANLGQIEVAQAQGVQSTTFFFHTGDPDPIRTCPSIGVPVPNTASLSNPEQAYWGCGGSAVVGQMDPNGIYVPEASSGTYVMCTDAAGTPTLTYWEGDVESEMGPAVWDKATHSIKPTGPSTFHFTTKQGQ